MKSIAKTRIEKELKMSSSSPTPGVSLHTNGDAWNSLTGVIIGAPGTPFEHGVFNLAIQIPDRYPFEPPCLRFVTRIYHPNIDTEGRICLDTLKPPPQGSWKPQLNLSTVLMSIQVLMAEPGTEDPLMPDIWREYRYDYPVYAEKARQWTTRYARGGVVGGHGSEVDTSMGSPKENHLTIPQQANQSAQGQLHNVPRKRLLGLKSCKKPLDCLENESDVKQRKT